MLVLHSLFVVKCRYVYFIYCLRAQTHLVGSLDKL